jgi:aldose 1-epimerase
LRLQAGSLTADFLPERGMLCASLRHQDAELLRRVDDLERDAADGSPAGIALLHPWANRLAGLEYGAAGRNVKLDPSSPWLHFDPNGLPLHGVPWSRLAWDVIEASEARIAARLEWSEPERLAVFPYPHRLELDAQLRSDGLTFETTLVAGPDTAVPVAFGFHPYFGLPHLPRARWRLELPAMRRLLLDARRIPTGEEEPCERSDARLGERSFDDGFRLTGDAATLSLSGAGRRISVDFVTGYRYAQLYAPPGQELVSIEPMTAPANALASGRGLTLVAPGDRYRAAFRIDVSSATR